MNAAHVHLILNHIPVLGTIFGLGLLAVGLWRKSDALNKAALTVFVIVSLVTVPVYLTGEPAEDVAKPLPGVSGPIIEQHEDVAAYAFGGVIVVGLLALGGLLWFHAGKPVPVPFVCLVFATAVAVGTVMAWTANLGGQVRHSEIRAGAVQFSITTEQREH